MKQHEFSEPVIAIDNAGLVILHQFLLPLFENLNWCKGIVWRTDECRDKAVLATQFLVTGKQEYDSKALALNKMICGFPADQPINTAILLSTKEMNECTELLVAVISYWKNFNNCAIETLQEHYLQRAGKILERNGQTELWLEKRPIDIFLKDIPWSFHLIKTPWMPMLLHCHW